ncbi:MAG: hypothetical protein P4M09_16950 [Devosia sp.]|nr:hypothetical protein [Devosia sp.]
MSRGGRAQKAGAGPAQAEATVRRVNLVPLGPLVLREAIRAEHEGRHADAAALRITDRSLGEVILSLPLSIVHADGELRQRLTELLSNLTC